MLRSVAFVLFKRKYIILTLAALGIAIMVYGAKTQVARYEASARILIRRVAASYQMPAESTVVLKREEVVNSEIQIITSEAVAERVVDRLQLAEGKNRAMVIARLQKGIKGSSKPETHVIDITYKDTDPDRAARIVNAVLDAYLKVRKDAVMNYQAVGYLEAQAERISTQIDSLAYSLAEFRGGRGQLHQDLLNEQHMMLIASIGNEATKQGAKIAAKEQELAAIEAWLDSGGDPAQIPSTEIYTDYSVMQPKKRAVEISTALARAQSVYDPEHPEVKRLERERVEVEAILRQEVELALERRRMALEDWKAEKRAKDATVAELRLKDPQITEDAAVIRVQEAKLGKLIALYNTVSSLLEQYRITSATDPSTLNIGVVSRASAPPRPTPEAVNMQMVVGLFTILFGVVLVFGMEKMDHSLELREDVERYLGFRVLASIPERRA